MNIHRAALYVISIVALALGVTNAVQQKRMKPVTIHAAGALSAKQADRLAAAKWEELEQSAVDAITAALGKLDKRPVTIFCKDKADCGDLALDLENAFESAHWIVDVQQPLLDETKGIGCSDVAVAELIAKATGLRVSVINAAYKDNRVALVLGKKPAR